MTRRRRRSIYVIDCPGELHSLVFRSRRQAEMFARNDDRVAEHATDGLRALCREPHSVVRFLEATLPLRRRTP